MLIGSVDVIDIYFCVYYLVLWFKFGGLGIFFYKGVGVDLFLYVINCFIIRFCVLDYFGNNRDVVIIFEFY